MSKLKSVITSQMKKQAANTGTALNFHGKVPMKNVRLSGLTEILKTVYPDIYDYNVTDIDCDINMDIAADAVTEELGYHFFPRLIGLGIVFTANIEMNDGSMQTHYDWELQFDLTEFGMDYVYNNSSLPQLVLKEIRIDYDNKTISLEFNK